MSRECCRHVKEREVYMILVENLKRKILFKDLGVNWRIICSRYIKNEDERTWNGIV